MNRNETLMALIVLLAIGIIALAVQSDKPNKLAEADYKAMLSLDIMSASAVCSMSGMVRAGPANSKDMDACIGDELKKKAQSA